MIITLDLIDSFNPLLCLCAISVESQRISCSLQYCKI